MFLASSLLGLVITIRENQAGCNRTWENKCELRNQKRQVAAQLCHGLALQTWESHPSGISFVTFKTRK